jgi:hypothetical protein
MMDVGEGSVGIEHEPQDTKFMCDTPLEGKEGIVKKKSKKSRAA